MATRTWWNCCVSTAARNNLYGNRVNMRFGAHCSTAGGVWKALQRCKTIGGHVCQIFVKNNMQWLGKPFSAEDVALYASERKASYRSEEHTSELQSLRH